MITCKMIQTDSVAITTIVIPIVIVKCFIFWTMAWKYKLLSFPRQHPPGKVYGIEPTETRSPGKYKAQLQSRVVYNITANHVLCNRPGKLINI